MAQPVFFSGQNYLGALQAYLAVPFFLLLGATPFALLATATVETIVFFLILYLFTREVFSREVALVTLLLVAAGPFLPSELSSMSARVSTIHCCWAHSSCGWWRCDCVDVVVCARDWR